MKKKRDEKLRRDEGSRSETEKKTERERKKRGKGMEKKEGTPVVGVQQESGGNNRQHLPLQTNGLSVCTCVCVSSRPLGIHMCCCVSVQSCGRGTMKLVDDLTCVVCCCHQLVEQQSSYRLT